MACLLLAAAAGCTFAPAPTQPRPRLAALPLATSIAPVTPATTTELVDHGDGRCSGTLVGSGEEVHFSLHRQEPSGRPLVLLVPILAGGTELMDAVAQRLLARGFDVAWCDRAGRALQPGQRGGDLDELFRRTVLQQRLLLDWLRRLPTPPRATFVLGISLGGMVTTVLAAVEPELAGVAICLSGGDVAELIAVSSERRVQSWRRWRMEQDGVGDDHLRWELSRLLQHDPLRFAPAVATERVLLVRASFDTVVPGRHQDLLWEALGRPARLSIPLGHYSAALAIDGILAAVAGHFDARLVTAMPAAP